MLESLFNKVAQSLLKRDSNTGVFLKPFENTYSEEHCERLLLNVNHWNQLKGTI